jgi:hypothetical protein
MRHTSVILLPFSHGIEDVEYGMDAEHSAHPILLYFRRQRNRVMKVLPLGQMGVKWN